MWLNTLNLIGKGWAGTEPEGLSPGSQGELLVASSQVLDVTTVVPEILWYCQRNMYMHWKNGICKCQSRMSFCFEIYIIMSPSPCYYSPYTVRLMKGRQKQFHRCKLGRSGSFTVPHLPGTWPRRREQANKKSMSCQKRHVTMPR